MELALKSEKRSLIIALVLTVMLVVGIPFIVVGATQMHDNKAFAAMLAIGIAFAVVGFYGSPIGWVRFGNAKQELTVVRAINFEHLHTVADLAQRLSINGKQASDMLNNCIRKGYLTGYIREGDTLVLNENTALTRTTYNVECSHCGASVIIQKGDSKVCPYCGCLLDIPDAKK